MRPLRVCVWMLVVAGCFVVLQGVGVTGRASPDTKNYVHYALVLRGASPADATREAVAYYCSSHAEAALRDQRVDPEGFRRAGRRDAAYRDCQAWVARDVAHASAHGPAGPFTNQRFMRIFDVRPGYPLLLAPFTAVFGLAGGVWAAAVTATALGGVLVAAALRTAGTAWPAAIAGQLLYYALPSVETAMRPLAEGAFMMLTAAVLLGCALLARGRAAAGGTLLTAGLAAAFLVKYSQAMLLGLALTGAYAAMLAAQVLSRHRDGLRAGAAAARLPASPTARLRAGGPAARLPASPSARLPAILTALLTTALWTLPHALHWPTGRDSAQDLLTAHYSRPDLAHPWPPFLHLEADFWLEWLRRQAVSPLLPLLLVVSAWALWRYARGFAAVAGAIALSGVLNQAGHPNMAIGDRLIVLVWFLPVCGLPVLIQLLGEGRVPGFGTPASSAAADAHSSRPPVPAA